MNVKEVKQKLLDFREGYAKFFFNHGEIIF